MSTCGVLVAVAIKAGVAEGVVPGEGVGVVKSSECTATTASKSKPLFSNVGTAGS